MAERIYELDLQEFGGPSTPSTVTDDYTTQHSQLLSSQNSSGIPSSNTSASDLESIPDAADHAKLEASYPTATSPELSSPPSLSGDSLPLLVAFGHLRQTIAVSSSLYFAASYLKDQFIASLQQQEQDGETDAPKSHIELTARFVDFVLSNEPDYPATEDIVKLLFDHFEAQHTNQNDIHVVIKSFPSLGEEAKLAVIRSYFAARAAIKRTANEDSHRPALLRAAADGSAKLYAVFGGQGLSLTYFDELRTMYETYPFFLEDILQPASNLLYRLSTSRKLDGSGLPRGGLRVGQWLNEPSTAPKDMTAAAISFPLIGLLQLARYAVTCRTQGLTPGQFLRHFAGLSGHSQGVVTAAAIGVSDTWESFRRNAQIALQVLFWTGVRSQQVSQRRIAELGRLESNMTGDAGEPSPMLGVRQLTEAELQSHIDAVNRFLQPDATVSIALANGPTNFVVAGPPLSLHGLSCRLREVMADPSGPSQAKTPYSKRKSTFTARFLPITAPFHSAYAARAAERIANDLRDLQLRVTDLILPFYDTETGEDFRSQPHGGELTRDKAALAEANMIPGLVRMIVKSRVNWELASRFDQATHIVDFGPGGPLGIGALTHNNKRGRGVRVLFAGVLDGHNPGFGYQAELFDRSERAVVYNARWSSQYAPTLLRNSTGQAFVSTKLSRLLGLPPIIVGGMTPTTVPWDFVSATMSAGYAIELAAGGYHSADRLEAAIRRLADHIAPGRGINVNVLYVNPKALAWQIPLIGRLRAEGINIEGLTVGAGVPSPEVASEYIGLGITHISFKPGSLEGITAVIAIAKAHPDFPVIMQWTGGRAGGHHSYEDFHEPILRSYAQIRQCENLILVAGSGFGETNGSDAYPYLTGAWSTKLGDAAMPFDGVLYGSRVMIAQEAHTSPGAKQAIADAAGLDPEKWESTLRPQGAGGILTVISEMGEPIHKLATRGVQFWAEMDRTIFKLPRDKRIAELKKKKNLIIHRLNADFQKVWFGRNKSGPTDLDRMTYGEVLQRLVDLLYISKEGVKSRWIDPSFEKMVADFARRVEERFVDDKDTDKDYVTAAPDAAEALSSSPRHFVQLILKRYSDASVRLMTAEDIDYFLLLSRRPGQKPVPFIPVLDEHFETYFKKDSLWQSENLEAVIDGDAQRTCILHGPVAARFSTPEKVDEPIASILDGINSGLIASLLNDSYHGDVTRVPETAYFGGEVIEETQLPTSIVKENHPKGVVYRFATDEESPLPAISEWISVLAGQERSWLHALFTIPAFAHGTRVVPNPFPNLFAPQTGSRIVVHYPGEVNRTRIIVQDYEDNHLLRVWCEGREIFAEILNPFTITGTPAALLLRYEYHPEAGYAPIREVMKDRNARIREFYRRTWLGEDPLGFDEKMRVEDIIATTFDGDETTISEDLVQNFYNIVGGTSLSSSKAVPMDMAVILGWKALVKPLFLHVLGGDLLRLVHVSNSFKALGAPLQEGEVVRSVSRVSAILNQDAGKLVEVLCTIVRNGAPALEVTSQFLFRGAYTDFDNTFESVSEPTMTLKLSTAKDVALLKSRKWALLDEDIEDGELLGQVVTLHLKTRTRFKSRDTFRSVATSGIIRLAEDIKGGSATSSSSSKQVGRVRYTGKEQQGNAVMAYLRRYGSTAELQHDLEKPVLLTEKPVEIQMPDSNVDYAELSGDYNPIHVCSSFAAYAKLPGTITHGMHTSAAVRRVVEAWSKTSGRATTTSSPMHLYKTSFVGMVLPGDVIEVRLRHVAMLDGRKVVHIAASKKESGDLILRGEAHIDQPLSAYIFTGQGSQEVGMGMELYGSSPAAREIWDRADRFFTQTYGFAITTIVRDNPKELTVHFGGRRGRDVRKNYLALELPGTTETGMDGSIVTTSARKVFDEITPETASYTFRHPEGLLFATQFAQPALTLMCKAQHADLTAKGLVAPDALFAGHSLGEYAALATAGDLLSVEGLMSVTWFRGLTMRLVVPYDGAGRSEYGMLAVNPSKVGPAFGGEAGLRAVVAAITARSGWLLEVVNYNIANLQYVCAGTLRALRVLGDVLEEVRMTGIVVNVDTRGKNSGQAKDEGEGHDQDQELIVLIDELVAEAEAEGTPFLQLQKSASSTPLKGVDVPFHSSFLRPGVAAYRSFLRSSLGAGAVKPELLLDRWVPNVTGKLFGISRRDFEEVYRLTGSDVLGEILERWDQRLAVSSAVDAEA